MERFRRAAVTGIAAAALLAGSVGAAVAVVSPPPPVHGTAGDTTSNHTTIKKKPAHDAKITRPALTARADVSRALAWQQIRVRGTAEHLRPGTKVTLQQLQGKRWVSLPASMNTTRTSAYNMRVFLGFRGRNALRIVGGGTVSPVFHVWVR
jgi:hypothetical protein